MEEGDCGGREGRLKGCEEDIICMRGYIYMMKTKQATLHEALSIVGRVPEQPRYILLPFALAPCRSSPTAS